MTENIETGWLLERRSGCKIEWIYLEHGIWGWTEDSVRALRLARRVDANAIAELIEDVEYVTEHQWGRWGNELDDGKTNERR